MNGFYSLVGNRFTARIICTSCLDSSKKSRYIQARGAGRERKQGKAMALRLVSPCHLFGVFRADYLYQFRNH